MRNTSSVLGGAKAGFLAGAALILSVGSVQAAELTVTADRPRISEDESVSVKFSLRTQNAMDSTGKPSLKAPDFDVVNEYSGVFVESYYENGRFGMRSNRTVTLVLKPKRAGRHRISEVGFTAGNQKLTAPDLWVEVTQGGAGTPPPRNYGGGGIGLRGAGKTSGGASFMVKAEVDHNKVYQGEQLIVSYYLYSRVRVSQTVATKYPTLNGFIKEDLEIPVGGMGQLVTERVMLDGVPYSRTLLARFAAYPIRAGKVSIDSMQVNLTYFSDPMGFGEDADDVMNLFQRMIPTTRSGSVRSELLPIEVEALPAQNRPADFSGGVGEFEISSAIDRTELRAHEPVTLTLKVEGKGNTSPIEAPKLNLPPGLELYESKGRVKTSRTGTGEKIFEFVLIPRAAGTYQIPAIQLSSFSPAQKNYVTRATPPIELRVAENPNHSEGAPLSSQPAKAGSQGSSEKGGDLAPWPAFDWSEKEAEEARGAKWLGRWAGLAPVFTLLAVLGLIATVGRKAMDRIRRFLLSRNAAKSRELAHRHKAWKSLEAQAVRAQSGASWQEVAQAYEAFSGALFDLLDRWGAGGARSLSRPEMAQRLKGEQGLPEEIWRRAEQLLEYAETVRFATRAGAVTEQEARGKLGSCVEEAKRLEAAFQPPRKRV